MESIRYCCSLIFVAASLMAQIPAGGDLSGNYPAPTVAKIQGRSVDATAPGTNCVYAYDGSKWAAVCSLILTGSPAIQMANEAAIQAKDDGGTYRNLIRIESGGSTVINAPSGRFMYFTIGDVVKANIDNDGNFNMDGAGRIATGSVVFASLPTVPNGTFVYCSNCDPSSGSICSSAGAKTGAMAMRVNSAWKCY